jgi:ribosomal protein S18 acetylase RimI-like enzyme
MMDEMTQDYFDSNSNNEIWLTYNNPEPIGLLYCAPERMADGTHNALLLAIHKEHQGKGIGSELMAFLENHLRNQGERVLLVETSGLDEFEMTRQFYKNNNYEIIARIPEYYEAGDDKVIFYKNLNNS